MTISHPSMRLPCFHFVIGIGWTSQVAASPLSVRRPRTGFTRSFFPGEYAEKRAYVRRVMDYFERVVGEAAGPARPSWARPGLS